MAFQQGLSGLNAASAELDVIGNNIANAGTTGFKASTMQFASLYASALSGGGGNAIGIGVSPAHAFQQFTQGVITASNNPLSMAVNGNGFFQVSNNGSIAYTRDGQFHVDANGSLVTSSGAFVQGYMANANGVLNKGVTTNLVINAGNKPPQPTTQIGTVLNLDASLPVLNPAAFDPNNDATFSYSSSLAVYDSLGNSHALQTYYVKKAGGQWDVYATIDGTLITTPPSPIATLVFKSDGSLDPAATTPVTTPLYDFTLNIPFTNGATSPQPAKISYTGTTQYGSPSAVSSAEQDGFAAGQLTQFGVGPDGTITGNYSNGQTQTLGQITLTSFVNPNGLEPTSNNQWFATAASGVPLVGTPGGGSLGVIQANAVESSTTDLTAELVNMIEAQQVYQANAKTIQTADQLSQTLFNI